MYYRVFNQLNVEKTKDFLWRLKLHVGDSSPIYISTIWREQWMKAVVI